MILNTRISKKRCYMVHKECLPCGISNFLLDAECSAISLFGGCNQPLKLSAISH